MPLHPTPGPDQPQAAAATAPRDVAAAHAQASRRDRWRTVGIVLAFALAYEGWQQWRSHRAVGAGIDDAQVAAVAARVPPGELTIYSAPGCAPCAAALAWLRRHRVAHATCDIGSDAACEARWRSLGGLGTPFVTVERDGVLRYARNGFVASEVLTQLAR